MKIKAEWNPTPEDIGKALAEMDDDAQARVFVAAALELDRIVAEERRTSRAVNLGADWQWGQVGRHLADCACSHERARDLVQSIFDGMCDALESDR